MVTMLLIMMMMVIIIMIHDDSVDHYVSDHDDDKGDVEDDANQANSQLPYFHHLCSLMTKCAKTLKTISKILH